MNSILFVKPNFKLDYPNDKLPSVIQAGFILCAQPDGSARVIKDIFYGKQTQLISNEEANEFIRTLL